MYYGRIATKEREYEIKARTLPALKAQASKICNKHCNSYDCMTVWKDNNLKERVTFFRINKKYPNNTIEYGDWH